MGKADMSQRLIHISGRYYIEGIMSQLPLTLKPDTMRGKTVLFRADLNVPMQDGKVTDTTRIERITDSITALADHGAKVIVLSHYGRPKGKIVPEMSLAPVAEALSVALRRPVRFIADVIGVEASKAKAELND
ncbi:MAG: phosphoglycerate kinase, partial [Candidatus Puniceispirillales bacterium]